MIISNASIKMISEQCTFFFVSSQNLTQNKAITIWLATNKLPCIDRQFLVKKTSFYIIRDCIRELQGLSFHKD